MPDYMKNFRVVFLRKSLVKLKFLSVYNFRSQN